MKVKIPIRDIGTKIVKVIDKDNVILSSCSFEKAVKLINRNCAVWTGDNIVKLLINDKDRKKLRKQIIEEAGRICYICGEYITKNQYPTLDHIYPKSQMGKEEKKIYNVAVKDVMATNQTCILGIMFNTLMIIDWSIVGYLTKGYASWRS